MLKNVFSAVKGALADRKGVTAAEYAVLATGIVLVVGIAASALGTRLSGIFATIGVPTP
jgi:Flp pilus assembly pilin Flp